jgi:hypothetical protein
MTSQEFKTEKERNGDSGKEEASKAFYIGWMGSAPKTIAGFIKKYLFFIFPIAILLACLLALSQKKFGTGNFEFGQLTDIKGIYFNKPVPCLKVVNGKDIWGQPSYLTIPLVGYGKHGAAGTISDIEEEKKTELNNKELTLRGTLLYNDGVTIMQIDKNDGPVRDISGTLIAADLLPQIKELGIAKVRGEIIDPKCYFGVMKPGEGKPHRDCAIRCILGGISPMLAVKNEKGEASYYLLVGPDGEPVNKAVQDYVAEPVEINARLVQYDDWIVAYLDTKEAIKRYSWLRSRFENSIQDCSVSCMK